jgi:hypothetical protein
MTPEDSDLAFEREERALFPRSSSPPKSLFELETHCRLSHEATAPAGGGLA